MTQFKLSLILGVLCIPGFSAAQNSNRISLQTGLLHTFFDGSPVMNFAYPNSAKKPFKGLLINSVGVQYRRSINEQSTFSVDVDVFHESYDKHESTYPTYEPMAQSRHFRTLKLNYVRIAPLNAKMDFVYGGGINFRTGSELIMITRGILAINGNDTIFEILAKNLGRNDFGLNAFAGIDYTPVNWWTFSAKIDFLGSVILSDKKGRKEMKDVYDSPQFPSRYDFSFNLGVGFNF
jgi:hypothetical protein